MPLTVKQWNAYLAVLLQHVDPETLDKDVLQRSIIDDPQTAGVNFNLFLQSGCQFNLGSLVVTPVPFDPFLSLDSELAGV